MQPSHLTLLRPIASLHTVFAFVGFLLANEQRIMEAYGSKYFVALVWAQSAINNARKEGRIKEDIGAQKLFMVRLETSGQNNLTYGRIAAAHGSFMIQSYSPGSASMHSH